MLTGYTTQLLDENLDLNGFVWRIAKGLVLAHQESSISLVDDEARLREAEKSLDEWRFWPEHVRRSVVEAEVLHDLAHFTRERTSCAESQKRLDAMKAEIAVVSVDFEAQSIVDYAAAQLDASTLHTGAIDEMIAELSGDGYVDMLLERRERDLLERVEYRRTCLENARERRQACDKIIAQLTEAVGPPPSEIETES